MRSQKRRFSRYDRATSKAAKGIAIFVVHGLLVLFLLSGRAALAQMSHQSMIHEKGHHVMPFELKKTLHVFEMTESGGIQQVIARDPGDKEQIALIQQHLRHEAMQFSKGDFSDPASLHGADMPGIKALASSASRVKIEYAPLPNGAQITFTTGDLRLITAIHRWFGAQLSDHGSDATYR
jgi:hypothetical protein